MLITIVVNCYNRADMVCTALDSVWKQTYRPIELIIVDDGSKDNTFDVVQEWVKKHPDKADFTTIAKTFPNGKLCVARNRGLELAHGEYIQYVDDDDWLYPEAIEKKVKTIQKHGQVDLLVNQLDFIYENKIITQTHITVPPAESNAIVYLLTHECLMSPVLMFKTEKLREIGAWKAGLIFADDMEITIRLSILGGSFALVDESLSGYRVHGQIRQCTTIRARLPYDFCPRLYMGLFQLAKEHYQESLAVCKSFAGLLRKDSKDFIHEGNFAAAQYCIQVANDIEQGVSELMPLRKRIIPPSWHLCRFFWILRRFVKRLLLNR